MREGKFTGDARKRLSEASDTDLLEELCVVMLAIANARFVGDDIAGTELDDVYALICDHIMSRIIDGNRSLFGRVVLRRYYINTARSCLATLETHARVIRKQPRFSERRVPDIIDYMMRGTYVGNELYMILRKYPRSPRTQICAHPSLH